MMPKSKPDLRSIGDRPRSASGERVTNAIKEEANPQKIVKPISKFEKPSSCLNSATKVMTLDNPADIPKSIKKQGSNFGLSVFDKGSDIKEVYL